MKLFGERLISAFKYLLAIFMIVAGIATAIQPLYPTPYLGFIFAHRLTLVAFGMIFSCSGFTLLIGKLRKRRKIVGAGLLAIYLCFFFSTFLNGAAFGWVMDAWLANAIATLITGALYLRWRMKTEYIDPKHFKDMIDSLPPR